jgi:hypothetical protein
MVVEKYTSKADVLQWVNLQDEVRLEAGIPDIIMDEAHGKVDAEIVNKKCFDITVGLPTEVDDNMFLKFAAFSYALALLCKAGIIGQTSGEIASTKFGEVMYQFQRTNPLFFFATGASEPFMDLLPYETLRMYAYSFIRAYCLFRFYEKYNRKTAQLKFVCDKTSRGYGWNRAPSTYDVADAETGEILDGAEDYR